MIVTQPKLNDVMYHWYFCKFCRGTNLGTILHHLDLIKQGIKVSEISKADQEVLNKFPLMTDTIGVIHP